MENLDKKIVQKNFSNSAESYDKAASIQDLSAQELSDSIQRNDIFNSLFLSQKKIRILDLGSGTSFLSKKFIHYKNVEIFEIDLAFEMLKQWKNRPSNIFPIQADFEKLPLRSQSFDVIISSFSLQWLSDFGQGLTNFVRLLKPGGIFAFAIPTNESLAELRQVSVDSGCNFYFKNLPQVSELEEVIKKSGFVEILKRKKTMKEAFSSGVEALKSFKKIGASYSENTKNVITKSQLNTFNRLCRHMPVCYEVLFFILQKV